MKTSSVCLLAGVLGWVAGCAQPQQIELIEREQRRLRSETNTMSSNVESMRSTLADTRANFQEMQRDVSALKERMDETRVQVGKQIGQSSREGDQRTKNLESRLTKLEEELKAQGELLKSREEALKQLRETMDVQQKEAQRTSQSDGLAESAAGESDAIRRDYEAAWRIFERKDFKLAIGRFKEFLKKYPKSRLAGNAQYWIGESHYALKEFDQAIIEFDAVRRRYPQAEKVPSALLR